MIIINQYQRSTNKYSPISFIQSRSTSPTINKKTNNRQEQKKTQLESAILLQKTNLIPSTTKKTKQIPTNNQSHPVSNSNNMQGNNMAKKKICTNLIQFTKTNKEIPTLDKQNNLSKLPSTTNNFNLLRGSIKKKSTNIIVHTKSARKTPFRNLLCPKQNLSPFLIKNKQQII